MVARPLSDALGAFLPGALETTLLRTCLLPEDHARRAWEAFSTEAGDLRELFRADYGRLKRLGPMVAFALRRTKARADQGLLTVLRTAYVREQLRTDAYAGILEEALTALARERIPALLVRGAASARTIYPEAALRHAHDIDLLVRVEGQPSAARALIAAGFRPAVSPIRTIEGTLGVEHRTTTPVNLHTRLLEPPLEPPAWEALWSERQEIPGLEGAVGLSPEASMLLTLGYAATSPTRGNLQWVLDAWHLLDQHPQFCWDKLAAGVTRSRLVLPAWIMLRYLRSEFGVAIPDAFCSTLEALASAAAPLDRDRSLFMARLEPGESAGSLVRRGSSPRARLTILRWLLFPSAPYVRRAYAVANVTGLPAAYLRRLVGYARS